MRLSILFYNNEPIAIGISEIEKTESDEIK